MPSWLIKDPCSTLSESISISSSLIALANIALVPPLSLYRISIVRALDLSFSPCREILIPVIAFWSSLLIRRATSSQMLWISFAIGGSSSDCKSAGGPCRCISTKIKAKQFNVGQRLIEIELTTLMVAFTVAVKRGQVGNLSLENWIFYIN